MKIIVDKDGEKAVKTSLDNILRLCGLEGLPLANSMLKGMTRIPEDDDKNEKQEDA